MQKICPLPSKRIPFFQLAEKFRKRFKVKKKELLS
ncbi:hypothetical protein NEOC95_001749 [Neochlamydia sp. AcF95]|nr:hypothetical protein [Neochlamydia sp. AcF95]